MTEGYLGITSVVQGNSAACIEPIFRIHFQTAETVLDLTWGKGRFWKWEHNRRIIGCDVDTRGGAQIISNYRAVPFKDQSVDVAVYDPPFIFSPGLRGIVGAKRFFLGSPEANTERFYAGPKAVNRVQAPRNAKDLEAHTIVAMAEMRRVARLGMILKGQNLITDQHPNWWTYQIIHAGLSLGIGWPEDELLQISPAPRIHDQRWTRQLHFRRVECHYVIWRW